MFSTTFYPLSVYPRALQVVVECTPLYQAITLIRGLTLGVVGPALLVPVALASIQAFRDLRPTRLLFSHYGPTSDIDSLALIVTAGHGQIDLTGARIRNAALTVNAAEVVVDASAAYLQRQGLDTIADGAALRGADLGATGEETYRYGVPRDRLELTAAAVRGSVHDYLLETGAWQRYPGLTYTVSVDASDSSVTVRVRAPLDLPLTVPGSPSRPSIGAAGSAVVSAEG